MQERVAEDHGRVSTWTDSEQTSKSAVRRLEAFRVTVLGCDEITYRNGDLWPTGAVKAEGEGCVCSGEVAGDSGLVSKYAHHIGIHCCANVRV